MLENGTVGAVVDAPEGFHVLLIVFRSAVSGVVAVPGRDIHAKLETLFPTGFREFLEHIHVLYAMPAGGIGPEAEAVVVLGGNDDAFHAGRLGRTRPLPAVQFRGPEEVLGLQARPPFQPAECIGAEVHEHIHLHLLPFQLRRRRRRTIRLRLPGASKDDGQASC